VGLRPLACWDCGFESLLVHGCLSLVSVVYCQVQVSATGRSLVQRSPSECGVSEFDLETSTIRRPRPTRGCRIMKKISISDLIVFIYLTTFSQLHRICRTEQKGKQRMIYTMCHGAVWFYLRGPTFPSHPNCRGKYRQCTINIAGREIRIEPGKFRTRIWDTAVTGASAVLRFHGQWFTGYGRNTEIA
jgi:hypothetical protein